MSGRAGGGFAWDCGGGGREVERRRERWCFRLAEDAFEWRTRKPNEVAACVKVKGNGWGIRRRGAESEGESIVTAG